MSDLSRVVSGYANVSGEVWDPLHQRLLFAADGALKSLDPLTGLVTNLAIPGAHELGDLDVSPDGAFVVITETAPRLGPFVNGASTPGTDLFYRVSLATGRVETLTFPAASNLESGVADIALTSSGAALLATYPGGDGETNVRLFSVTDTSPIFHDLPQGTEFKPELFPSDSHRYVLVAGGGISNGPFVIFDALAGRITAQADMQSFPGHQLGFGGIAYGAVSDAAQLVAVTDRGGDLVVTDLSLHLVKDLSFSFNLQTEGVAFSHDGRQLFVMQRQAGEVLVFDTSTWTQLGVVKTQTSALFDGYFRGGNLSTSADGRFLFVMGNTDIEVVDLNAHALSPPDQGLVTDVTVISDTTRVAAGQTVTHVDEWYYLSVSPGVAKTVLDIAGTVSTAGTSFLNGVNVGVGRSDQLFLIESTGVLRVSVSGSNATAHGYYEPNFDGPSFENRGLLEVTSTGDATGIASYALDGSYKNSGVVHVTAPIAFGFNLKNLEGPGVFVNSGLIEINNASGQTAGGAGVILSGNTSSFTNAASGTIIVGHAAAPATSIAVEITTSGGFRPDGVTYGNAGLIQGDIALVFSQSAPLAGLTYQRIFYNEATGVLRGVVQLTGDGVILKNAGLIDGPVNLGSGAETYDGSLGGRVAGMVSGGAGDDRIMGGAASDNFQGNQGNDTINGGGGDDVVVGGKDNDSQTGDAGDDIVWGNLGNDTLDGGEGNDQVRGGQGDDSVAGGAGNDFISGDRGNDTETGGTGSDIFHTSQDAGIDRVLDFHLSEGDRVQVDPGTTYSVSQVGSDTVIDMGAGNQMILVGVSMSALTGNWIFGA
jgi:Ca2+-binding RTX toxin-like protein